MHVARLRPLRVMAVVAVFGAAACTVPRMRALSPPNATTAAEKAVPSRARPDEPPEPPPAQPLTQPPPPPAASPQDPRREEATLSRAILVTLDGVRWQDVFEGVNASTPRASSWPRTWELLGRRGVALGHGSGCGIVRPRNTTNISQPGYLEIFTGRRTQCMSNVCPRVTVPTVLDAAALSGLTVASISSWEMIDYTATRAFGTPRPGALGAFVSAGTRWPGHRPLEARLEEAVVQGERAAPYPALGGTYRPDRYTAPIALEYLRTRRPRLLHIGLGDTDEYGHRDDYSGYVTAFRGADAFIGALADTLDAMGLSRSTTVIVVTDHGRATVFREHGPSWPESGRSFILAFGGRVPVRGEACSRHDLWLTDIAPTLRAVLGLAPDASPESVGKPIEEIVGP
jgi:hypothetical protein